MNQNKQSAHTSPFIMWFADITIGDIPEFAQFLVEQGIDSISLNPDTVLKTTLAILSQENA